MQNTWHDVIDYVTFISCRNVVMLLIMLLLPVVKKFSPTLRQTVEVKLTRRGVTDHRDLLFHTSTTSKLKEPQHWWLKYILHYLTDVHSAFIFFASKDKSFFSDLCPIIAWPCQRPCLIFDNFGTPPIMKHAKVHQKCVNATENDTNRASKKNDFSLQVLIGQWFCIIFISTVIFC